MTRQFILGCSILGVAMAASTARAEGDAQVATSSGTPGDLSIAAFDPTQAVNPISIVEGPGVKVGEGTVIHPVFGMETGVDSNVFYTQNDPQAAGMLRLMAQVGIASLNQTRLNPTAISSSDNLDNEDQGDKGDLQYSASVRLAWDQPLSGNSTVTGTSGLGMGATFRTMVNPMGRVSFGLDENFVRMIRAANFETSQNINRDVNMLGLNLLYHPYDRAISGFAYYRNTLDIFEHSEGLYPNRMDHRFGLHPMWRLLPQTVLFADVSLGYVSGIGTGVAEAAKSSSMPLVARVGINTLFTPRLTLNFSAGYTNGFYASGPSFSAPVVDALATLRYSTEGRIYAGYSLQYTDSVNANYFRDHVLRVGVQHLVAPFAIMVQPELHFREYVGLRVMSTTGGVVRDDTIGAVTAGAYYQFRDWIAATLNYRLSVVSTDFRYQDPTGGTIDPSYTRHDLLAGLRIAM